LVLAQAALAYRSIDSPVMVIVPTSFFRIATMLPYFRPSLLALDGAAPQS
jgi:hypothetical protein